MPVPVQENIQQSLSRLKQSLPLFQQDIGNIAWAFAFLPNQDHLFLHYIINTDGPISELEEEDPFDVFDAATRYAQTLCVDVSKGQNEVSWLILNPLTWKNTSGNGAMTLFAG